MKRSIVCLISLFLLAACAGSSQVERALEENPDILFRVIEKHPAKFMEAVGKAEAMAEMNAQEEQEKARLAKIEAEFKYPLQPDLSGDRAVLGNANAPITIVEYTDFECPYCRRGHATLEQVKKAYPGKIKLIYKSLPLDFHPMAMPAALRFEAIALQDSKKAYAFHDEVFRTQERLGTQGEKHLDAVAKKVGANISRMKRDMNSSKVRNRVEADLEEAQKYGFNGTPAFIINGVSIMGAYPFETFKEIIDRHLAAK